MKKATRSSLALHQCKAGRGPGNKATLSKYSHSLLMVCWIIGTTYLSQCHAYHTQSPTHLNHGNKQFLENACHIILQLSTKLWWGGRRERAEKGRTEGEGGERSRERKDTEGRILIIVSVQELLLSRPDETFDFSTSLYTWLCSWPWQQYCMSYYKKGLNPHVHELSNLSPQLCWCYDRCFMVVLKVNCMFVPSHTIPLWQSYI